MDPKVILNVTMAAAAFAVVSLLINLIVIASSRRQRRNWLEVSKRSDEEIAALSRDLDVASQKAGEHARRIAWLESRIRNSQPTKTVSEVPAQQKITITERRHRVMSLARRGQDVQTIAQTLGMNHGEVELMINLGRAA